MFSSDMSERLEELKAALKGRYEIEKELGHGGMATVYLAEGTNKPYMKTGAFVEIEGLQEDLDHLNTHQSRRKLSPFDDIQAARDWLVEQATGEEGGGSG